MKKSVAPLILTEPVQSVRKCILPGVLRLFDNLKWGVTENFFDFSSEFLLLSSEIEQPKEN